MSYVDGFVLPVPAARLAEYRKLARLGSKVWRDHGALDYREFVADDVPAGKLTSFGKSVRLKEGEIVVFAYIVFKSRAHRDRVNKKAMADPRFHGMDHTAMPFDHKRMIYGGFKGLVPA